MLIAMVGAFMCRTSPTTARAADEVRALWVVRTTLTSPTAIATMVSSARAAGFNTLVVQVRGRGDAYYESDLEPRPSTLTAQAAFDPLATTIARAHEAGLRVHAWLNVNLVSGLELPSAREHVVYRHPEWLMVPKSIAEDLARLESRSPEYLGRLIRYARAHTATVEGIFLSPVSAESADYTIGIVQDVARRYAVDGVHLDYIRYPQEDFDYGRDTLSAFRRTLLPDLDQAARARYDDRLAADPLIYTRAFPQRWKTFRAERLTALVTRLGDTIKRARPGAVISAAVVPDPSTALSDRLQDWPGWVGRNLVDVICPMAYTTDAATFSAQIAAARQLAGGHPVWAGIGAYRLTPAQIAENVQEARRQGLEGIILFSYDSLTDPNLGPDYLTRVGRAAFAAP